MAVKIIKEVPRPWLDLAMLRAENRQGKFAITKELLKSDSNFVSTQILARCIITRCEFHYATNRFQYEALSYMFAKIASGQIVPEYLFEVTKTDEGKLWLTNVFSNGPSGTTKLMKKGSYL